MRVDRLVILSLLAACKAAVPTSGFTYSEDLSIHRPVTAMEENPDGEPKIVVYDEPYQPLKGHIKAEMDSIFKIALARNKEGRLVDGFVIQVYSGANRETANETRNKMEQLFPELNPRLSYYQPNFRVKGGEFTDRLEAHYIHKRVKEQFPRALLIPERFMLSYE